MEQALTIQNLSVGYGKEPVLQQVNLGVAEGEKLAIIGPNGCGKTTLLKAVAQLLPYEGRIRLKAGEVSGLKARELAKWVALLMQSSQPYFPYRVEESVAMGRYAHQKGWFDTETEEDKRAVERALNAVGLGDLKEAMTDQLSGGQLQRVHLARAFAQEPKIILLDEPTNHLDLKYQLELLMHLDNWVGEQGRSVVAVLHDLSLVRSFADRVALLYQGGVYAYGEPAQVLTRENLLHCYGMDVYGYMEETLARWQEA